MKTVVAKEMIRPKDNMLDQILQPVANGGPVTQDTDAIAKQPFRFMELSAELRNIIYGYTLSIDGAIRPPKDLPSSACHRTFNQIRRPGEPYPGHASVLALLQWQSATSLGCVRCSSIATRSL